MESLKPTTDPISKVEFGKMCERVEGLGDSLRDQIDSLRTQICQWEKAHAEKHELEREVLDTAKDSADMALNLNSSEIARRLEFLNGEAERLRIMQASYIPREMHESSLKEINRRLDSVVNSDEFKMFRNQVTVQLDSMRENIDRLKLVEANMRGQILAFSAAIGFALSVITFVLSKVL